MEALSADSASKVQVLLHHGDSIGVDGTKVGILKQTSDVALGSFLKGDKSGALEAELGVDTIRYCANKALERSPRKHELDRFLVSLNFSDGDCAGSESAFLLNSTLSGGSLLLCFGGLADLRSSSNALLGSGGLTLFLSCNLLSRHFFAFKF